MECSLEILRDWSLYWYNTVLQENTNRNIANYMKKLHFSISAPFLFKCLAHIHKAQAFTMFQYSFWSQFQKSNCFQSKSCRLPNFEQFFTLYHFPLHFCSTPLRRNMFTTHLFALQLCWKKRHRKQLIIINKKVVILSYKMN